MRQKPTWRETRGRRWSREGAIGLAAALCGSGALAQTPQTLPGLIVTVPPAQQQPAAPKAQPKPKKATARAKSASLSAGANDGGPATQSIALVVNGDPITGYEIDQRARFLALQANLGDKAQERFKQLVQSQGSEQRLRQMLQDIVQANPGKTREQILAIFEEKKKQLGMSLQKQAIEGARASLIPGLKKTATEELIEEHLKLQQAKRLNISIEDDQVETVVKGMAERNKMTVQQFADHVKGMGVDISTIRSRVKANLAWGDVVRRKFSAQISVNQREIDRMVSSAPGEDQVELRMQRIVIAIPPKLDQKSMAQKYAEADGLHAQFAGCKTTHQLAAKAQNARFEDMGSRRPGSFSEPTRSLLLNSKDGEMLPPSVTSTGIEMYAVCGRKVIKASEEKRQEAAGELRQQEFEILARRQLRDLRQDAVIESTSGVRVQ